MGQTRYYNLAYFDFGDRLNSSINVKKEIDRFVVIDKQLYGMYNIFGNGVIDGFNVSDAGFQGEDGISVNISQGTGIINFIAAQNEVPGTVNGLPPNSVVEIYAEIVGSTYLDRGVVFSYSELPVPGAIKIALVSTGADNIVFIDNSVRDLIGFEEIIQEAIDAHKHRGTPSKIDLVEEVRNQLPGSRLEGIDASKVVSGRFDVDRIPLVDHNDLEHNGMLTHAALDSFVRTFSQNNKELLGEINSVNLLKMIIFHKYKDVNVDEYFINELALLPGISPNEFIDFAATTANIDLGSGCISGIPSKTGIFTSVYWNDNFSFATNTFNNNIIIQNDTVFLDASDSSSDSIADFSGPMLFEEEMIIVDENQIAVVTGGDNGDDYGQFGGGGVLNYFYRLNYSIDEYKNWDGIYDEIVISVRTSEQVHAPVYMYVVNGSNIINNDTSGDYGSVERENIDGVRKPSSSWEILAKDENSATFVEKSFNINTLGLTDVSQITIFTSDPFTFDIDDILVRRTNIVSETGKIKFQYSTEASVTFHTIFYDIDTPSGTTASVKLKTASTVNSLSRGRWTQNLNSGDVIALTGSASEIEVVMTSDDSRTVTPILNSVELRLLTDANFTGFVIDTEDEFVRGTVSNLDINPAEQVGQDILNISTPINVGGRYFAKAGSVSENNDSDDDAVYGFSGSSMPISPVQARYWNGASSRGFRKVSSVVRRFDNSFLVADMGNNRVLQVDRNGNLVKGFGSTYSTDDKFYPLSAAYNPTNQVLSVAFTRAAVVVPTTGIEKISFFIGASQVFLTLEDKVLNNNKSSNKILEIELGDDTAVRLLNATSDNLTVYFGAGAFTDTIIKSEGMEVTGNNAIFSDLRGLLCFVGDFTFIDSIKHPIGVYETSENNWIILNSSIYYGGPNQVGVSPDATEIADLEAGDIPSIVEIDPDDISNTTDKLVSSDITFSDYTLGGIYEYTDNQRFVVSGIEKDKDAIIVGSGQDLKNIYLNATPPEAVPFDVEFRAAGIDALAGYVGRVFVLDKVTNKKSGMYTCPDGLYASDIDGYDNGDLSVAESALADSSGRIVRIDVYGNVTWSYGAGTFHIINDCKVISDDSLIVSV
jgi:hypothetical protein